jgi:hypothetical protein
VKVAVASFGLGAVGLITGSVAGALVLAKHSSLNGGPCSDGKCPASESGEVSSYRTLANVSSAAFVVAGVGAAAGGHPSAYGAEDEDVRRLRGSDERRRDRDVLMGLWRGRAFRWPLPNGRPSPV